MNQWSGQLSSLVPDRQLLWPRGRAAPPPCRLSLCSGHCPYYLLAAAGTPGTVTADSLLEGSGGPSGLGWDRPTCLRRESRAPQLLQPAGLLDRREELERGAPACLGGCQPLSLGHRAPAAAQGLENQGLDFPPGSFPEQPVPPPGADGQREGVSNLHEETGQAAHRPVGTGCPAPGAEAGGHPEGPEAGTFPSLCVQEAELRELRK